MRTALEQEDRRERQRTSSGKGEQSPALQLMLAT
jgi:hypothetical protein